MFSAEYVTAWLDFLILLLLLVWAGLDRCNIYFRRPK